MPEENIPNNANNANIQNNATKTSTIKQNFVHLHAHTHYSVQDALPSPTAYAMKAREMGFPAAAITDHGRMSGIVEFAEACRVYHPDFDPIKPLLGCEFYFVPDRFDKSRTEDGRRQKYNHLTLIAMNEVGYKNMMRMSAIASDPQVFHYSPRVDWEVIEQHNEGVIALSGCLASELSQAVLHEDEERSREVIERFLRTFGDRYYIELQYHGIPEQKHNLPHLIRYAREYNVPTVATNDTHYLERQDWKLHDILIQMRDLREDKASKNGKKEAYGTHQFYLKSEEEMRKIFAVGAPEAVENTVKLAARVEDFLKLDVPHLLPPANIPHDNAAFQDFWQKNLPYHKANEAYLAFLSFEGLKRVGKNEDRAYMRRLQSELQQIWYMGVTDYFLIQREMVEHMVSQGILFGIRGSGVGSLVNYCLEVCSVDPIRWNLMFERFLNPGRGTQYKIDYAVCPAKKWLETNGKQDQTESAKRLKALTKEFLTTHPDLAPHGPAIAKEVWVLENQGLASYVLDLADRGIVSEKNDSQLWTAYILGVTPEAPTGDMIVSKVAALPDVDTDIDDSRRGEVIEWARERFGHDRVAQIGTWGTYAAKASVVAALKTSERFTRKYGDRTHQEAIKISGAIPKKPGTTIEEALTESDEFQWYYTPWKEEIEIAKQIVGKISNLGVHAGGVLVASEPICEHSPIENSKGTVCSGYDMKNVERVGLVKYDYLGLATYQQLSIALRLIEKRHGKRIILNEIPLEDPKVFKTIYSRGKTASVFQFASKGMQEALRQVNASNTEDLIAVAALYRPGPMEYIPQYADGKRDPGSVDYAHPLIKKHLAVTYGIMVYQEQAMFLARDMAGFDWGEVDKLRKAISKKSGKDFDAACNLFRDKSLERGIPEKAVEEVLALMQKFGGYAFNRSHACSYAILSYWTAWLRTYYSSEWMAACIHVDRDDADKIAIFKKECRDDRIQVRDANINESGLETTVNVRGDIMMPLTSIKGVGTRAADLIALQPFENLQDLCWRGRPNRGVVEALARANALSCFAEINKITAQKDPEGATVEVMERWDELVEARTQEERRKAREAKAGYKSASPMQMQDDEDDEYAGRRRDAERPARPVTRKARSVMNPNKVFNEDLF